MRAEYKHITIISFTARLNRVAYYFGGILMSDLDSIKTLAGELSNLRYRKEDLESQLKGINKRKSEVEEQLLPALMERADVPKMEITGLGTLYLQNTNRAHIRAEEKPDAFDWFEAEGLGSLIKRDIHWKTLVGWVKERTENGLPVPEFCNAQFLQIARLRRK
jgi:hypothetical protein